MKTPMTTRFSPTTCRRILWPAALLAGLLTSEAFAAGSEQQTLAAIARRSFDNSEALAIARRSVGGTIRRPAAAARILLPAATGTRTGPTARTLDPVRLERTERYRDLIEHHSRLHHVDAALVQAIVYTESGGDALAVSPAGARGLMQLMPGTARELGVEDPLNPEQSISSGIRYLHDLLDDYGSTEVALWAYNAGPGAVQRGVLPSETTTYVGRVLAVRRALLTLHTRETVR